MDPLRGAGRFGSSHLGETPLSWKRDWKVPPIGGRDGRIAQGLRKRGGTPLSWEGRRRGNSKSWTGKRKADTPPGPMWTCLFCHVRRQRYLMLRLSGISAVPLPGRIMRPKEKPGGGWLRRAFRSLGYWLMSAMTAFIAFVVFTSMSMTKPGLCTPALPSK